MIDNTNYLDPDNYFGDELPDVCFDIAELVENLGGPDMTYRQFYRAVYKHSCGVMIGFNFCKADDEYHWVYGDDLPNVSANEIESFGVSVSSIVEGSDVEVDGDKLIHHFERDDFWKLVDAVCEEVDFYWRRDNSFCFTLTKGDDVRYYQWIDGYDKPEGAIDDIPVSWAIVQNILDNLYAGNGPAHIDGWKVELYDNGDWIF